MKFMKRELPCTSGRSPKKTKQSQGDVDDEDLDFDVFGGRKQRKGAIKELNESDDEGDLDEDAPKEIPVEDKFSVHREYEETVGDVEYDEKGVKIDAFNLDDEMEEG